MMLLVSVAVALANPQVGIAATVQATATIRVVRGATLKLDGSTNPEAPPPRATSITAANGSVARAEVIDFQ